jgi:hypothetical protein
MMSLAHFNSLSHTLPQFHFALRSICVLASASAAQIGHDLRKAPLQKTEKKYHCGKKCQSRNFIQR